MTGQPGIQPDVAAILRDALDFLDGLRDADLDPLFREEQLGILRHLLAQVHSRIQHEGEVLARCIPSWRRVAEVFSTERADESGGAEAAASHAIAAADEATFARASAEVADLLATVYDEQLALLGAGYSAGT